MHIPTDHIRDRELRRALTHASVLLADVYTMLGAEPTQGSNGGTCNFSIGLVLACIIDGLATEIWPIEPVKSGGQLKRMEALLLRLPWGSKADGWITRIEAAKVLYHEVRNPLVHNLGADMRWRGRRRGFLDAAIVLGMRDRKRVSPDELEALAKWDPKWPVVWAKKKTEPGPPRFVVSAPALYWHVKWLAINLAADDALLAQALQLRKRRRVK